MFKGIACADSRRVVPTVGRPARSNPLARRIVLHQCLQVVIKEIGVFAVTNFVHFVLIKMDENFEAALAEKLVNHSVWSGDRFQAATIALEYLVQGLTNSCSREITESHPENGHQPAGHRTSDRPSAATNPFSFKPGLGATNIVWHRRKRCLLDRPWK